MKYYYIYMGIGLNGDWDWAQELGLASTLYNMDSTCAVGLIKVHLLCREIQMIQDLQRIEFCE